MKYNPAQTLSAGQSTPDQRNQSPVRYPIRTYFIRRTIQMVALVTLLVTTVFTTILHAGEADVVEVNISDLGENRFRINVTLKHDDTGWDHYANKWVVIDESGQVIGTRELAHPHVEEQPFTRSLTVNIPVAVKSITLRGYDSIHAEGGVEMSIEVPGR